MITCKIDLTKLAHLCVIKKDRNGGEWMDVSGLFHGQTGSIYLDFVLWESENDKFGNDYRICESLSKEERENGTKAEILGNGKIRGSKPSPYNPGRNEQRQPAKQQQTPPPKKSLAEQVDDDWSGSPPF